jgi:hypothetical protein
MCEVPSAEPLRTVLQFWNTSCFPKSQADCGDETPQREMDDDVIAGLIKGHYEFHHQKFDSARHSQEGP